MKTWWQSKTIWVAIITILVAGLTQFTDVVAISPEVKNYILGAVGILNLVLRLFSTSVPIEPAAKVKRFNG